MKPIAIAAVVLVLAAISAPYSMADEKNAKTREETVSNQTWFSAFFSKDNTLAFKELNLKKKILTIDSKSIENSIRRKEQAIKELGNVLNLKEELRSVQRDRERYERRIPYFNKSIEKTKNEIESVEKKITKATTQSSKNELEEQLADFTDELAYLLDQKENSLARIDNEIISLKEKIDKAKDETNKLDSLRNDLRANEVELANIDNELSELLNRDNIQNSFRLNISIAFTLLVGVVIVGFYRIASTKDELAKTIFSGEKGIQFITLFLIIISIILFGIMGSLQSEELSALLGALSGYILGRTSKSDD